MLFKSIHDSYMIQTKKGVIKFTNGKYKTEDKAEITLLKAFPDVEDVAAIEAAKAAEIAKGTKKEVKAEKETIEEKR